MLSIVARQAEIKGEHSGSLTSLMLLQMERYVPDTVERTNLRGMEGT